MADDPLSRPEGAERTSRYDPTLDAAAMVAAERQAEVEAAAREAERLARRRTLLVGTVVVVVVLVASMLVAVLTTRRSTPGDAVGVGSDAFSNGGQAVPGAVAAAFSPDGTRLAVLRGGGSVGVSEGGRFRALVPEEAQITAFAWYDDNRLIVQEGPVSTGQLAVVDLNGEDKGVVKLDPDVSPGTGIGVGPDRRTLVVIGTVESTQLGGQPTVDLYSVTVPGGATRRLTTSPDAEARPTFLDDHRVAYTARADGLERVEVFDLTDGTTARLAQPAERALVVGVVAGEVLWWDGTDIVAASPGSGPPRRVVTVPSGSTPVAVSPDLHRLVVRDVGPSGDTILRLVDF